MNLFIMDKEDILKHYKPKTDEENYLCETLRDCYAELYAIQEVLSDYSLYWENPGILDMELKELTDEIAELKEVNQNWSNLFERLKDDARN